MMTVLTKYYPCLVEQPSTSSADHPRSVSCTGVLTDSVDQRPAHEQNVDTAPSSEGHRVCSFQGQTRGRHEDRHQEDHHGHHGEADEKILVQNSKANLILYFFTRITLY